MLADDQKVELDNLGGILVYQDSSDDIYYYSSTRPAVARRDGEYQFTLVRYDTPRDNHAGMLSLVIDLEPDEEQMKKLRTQLWGRTPGAEIKPMPWTSGTVAAAIIGGNPVFGTPSLLGSNSAVLCVGLTIEQYLLLKNSAKDRGASPISVVYSLSYEAFRPEYEFTIEFNESKFRDWLQKKCSANFLFISVEKIETFEELRQSGVIRVASVNRTGQTPPEGFRRAFLKSLQSLLVPLPRFATPPDGGGDEWLIGFSCSTVQDTQNIARRLDCNMQISGAVTRKAFIQGPLDRLGEALAARPEIELPTNTRFTQELTLRCHTTFNDGPLDAINVHIEPPTISPSSRVFNDLNDDEWPIELVHKPGTISDYSYRCELYFRDNPAKCSSGSIGIRRDQIFLDIVPDEFYTYRRYSVMAADEFPWDLLNSVELTLAGPEPLAFEPRQLKLSKTHPSGAIEAFAPVRTDLDEIVFTARYYSTDARSFMTDGLPLGKTIFLNPFRRRVVTFRAAADFNWQRYSRINISIARSAGKPQLWRNGDGKLTLTKATAAARFTYWFTDGRELRYRTTFMGNGIPRTHEDIETSDAAVVISDRDQQAV